MDAASTRGVGAWRTHARTRTDEGVVAQRQAPRLAAHRPDLSPTSGRLILPPYIHSDP